MKKLVSIFLVLVLVVGMFALSANALNVDAEETLTSSLFVSTRVCPNGYNEYVSENIGDFILSIDPAELPETGEISVGSPFCFANSDSDIFYFPILHDGTIIYMLRVFPKSSGGYGGVLGKSFVKELNAVAEQTDLTTPLTLMMEEDTVVAYIGGERNIIFEYPEGTVNCTTYTSVQEYSLMLSEEATTYCIVNANEQSATVNYSVSCQTLQTTVVTNETRESSLPTYKYLSMSITETQGGESWCAAYAAAMIIRYVKGNGDDTAAIDVMKYHFDNPSSSDAIGEADVVEYANSRSLYPTHVKYTLTDTSLKTQIANSKPVYLRMYRVSGSDKVYHAIVLRGYSDNTDKWSVWNPWYDYYDSFDMGGTYVPAEHASREYTYCHTIYNWS